MQGVVLFYKGDRVIHRHGIDASNGDFAKGVSDAIESFQRTYSSFELWDEAVSFKVLKADSLTSDAGGASEGN